MVFKFNGDVQSRHLYVLPKKHHNIFIAAAARCGFTDQSHMTRQFKRWIGVTPGEYYRINGS
ncbi:MAG: helix-turn-helix transcriptional regulator [Desulfobacula sp.]|nr:helix-turn-helix transcriptional regulator [Desulfobacula sp.]